jgi:hypothetical protein
MKNLLVLFLMVVSIQAISQDWIYDINFEDPGEFYRINFDTVLNPENIWQIGSPQKPVFTSAYSLPNAMVTGLADPYPLGDTSVFTITHIANDGFIWPHTVILAGYYKSDCDSLLDYGRIEFSPDQGGTWIDLINDPAYEVYLEWYTDKPVLTGLVPDWTYFYVNIAQLGFIFTIDYGDTLYYRFTFISDDNAEQRDGLIYDDLHFEDWWESTGEPSAISMKSKAWPNPSTGNLMVEFENLSNDPVFITFNDICGKRILSAYTLDNHGRFNLNDFSPGLYFYHLHNLTTDQQADGKVIIRP